MRPTDEDLALQLQRGSADALHLIIERYYPAISTYLYRLCGGDRPCRDDLVQETFLRLLSGIRGYEYPRPLRPWLYAIATNAARNQHKHARHTRPSGDDTAMPDIADDETPLPEQSVIAGETAQQVAYELLRLPAPQREVIILRYYQELSLVEIADTLALPLGTVKSRLRLGLEHLRNVLELQGYDG